MIYSLVSLVDLATTPAHKQGIPSANCLQADIKAKEDADRASQIDPKKAAILLAAGLTVRYYLLDIVKIMVILAILLGDASFVAALYVGCDPCAHSHLHVSSTCTFLALA